MSAALLAVLLLIGIYWLAAGRPLVAGHYPDGKRVKSRFHIRSRFLGVAVAASTVGFYWHRLVVVALVGGAVVLIALILVVLTRHGLVRRRR
jgi:hypothetical protein